MMDKNAPLVSVIMPAYRAGKYIEAAVASLQAQTLTDWELLVIDDCSPDDTWQIICRLAADDSRIVPMQNAENLGAAGTRNRGLDLARGQYVALLDSDDLWHPNKLEKQLACMEEHRADLSYTGYRMIDELGKPVRGDYSVPETVTFSGLLRENVIGCSTVMMTGNVARAYRFRTDFFHEDYVLWLTMLKDGYRAAGITEPLTSWRYAQNSRSFDKWKSAKNRWKIYRHYLKLNIWESGKAFAGYALAGFKKYRKR